VHEPFLPNWSTESTTKVTTIHESLLLGNRTPLDRDIDGGCGLDVSEIVLEGLGIQTIQALCVPTEGRVILIAKHWN